MSVQEEDEVKRVKIIKAFSEELSKKMAIWPGKYHSVLSMDSETDLEMFYNYHCLCQSSVLSAWKYLKEVGREGATAEEIQVATNELYESLVLTLKISADAPTLKIIE